MILRYKKEFAVLLTLSLLLLIWVLWQGEDQGRPQNVSSPKSPGEALMTGVRLSSWEDSKRTCTFEIQGLELTPKRWGPFKLADSVDIQMRACNIRVNQEAMSTTLPEIAKTLERLAGVKGSGALGPPNNVSADPQPLIVLPPKISAQPFFCKIDFPPGRWLTLEADLAAFSLSQPHLQLTGAVKVKSAQGACLQAEEVVWQVLEHRLMVPGPYTCQSGRRQPTRGRGREFSLAGGDIVLNRTAPTGQLAGRAQAPDPFGAVLTQAFSRKNFSGAQSLMLPFLAAAQTAGGKSPDLKNLTTVPPLPLPGQNVQ